MSWRVCPGCGVTLKQIGEGKDHTSDCSWFIEANKPKSMEDQPFPAARDAFPNMDEHGRDILGLTRAPEGFSMWDGKGRRWFSVCSMHLMPKKGCAACHVGRYELG